MSLRKSLDLLISSSAVEKRAEAALLSSFELMLHLSSSQTLRQAAATSDPEISLEMQSHAKWLTRQAGILGQAHLPVFRDAKFKELEQALLHIADRFVSAVFTSPAFKKASGGYSAYNHAQLALLRAPFQIYASYLRFGTLASQDDIETLVKQMHKQFLLAQQRHRLMPRESTLPIAFVQEVEEQALTLAAQRMIFYVQRTLGQKTSASQNIYDRIGQDKDAIVAWAFAFSQLLSAVESMISQHQGPSSPKKMSELKTIPDNLRKCSASLLRVTANDRRSQAHNPHYKIMSALLVRALEEYLDDLNQFVRSRTKSKVAHLQYLFVLIGNRFFQHARQVAMRTDHIGVAYVLKYETKSLSANISDVFAMLREQKSYRPAIFEEIRELERKEYLELQEILEELLGEPRIDDLKEAIA